MTALDFAQKHIRFSKSSPITGPFRIELYPFLGAPLAASDNLAIKRLTIFKASSSLGTVLGQILNAKRIVCDVGDQLMVCQTDDDAGKWTKTRGKEWLESIPDVMRLLKSDKYAQTNELWLFRHKFLLITGPGINAAQSDQVRYVQTDESHLGAYPNGRLVEFEKRMGGRWDRQGTHITTAPDQGREVDGFYHEADQNEFNWRCPNCNELIWALWERRACDRYNGERIFRWHESQSETETLDSIVAICPHCQHESKDTNRDRYALVRYGAYSPENPNAPAHLASYRWSVFNAHWIPWREMLGEYNAALRAASLNDPKPYEDFVKKRECMTYRGEMPEDGRKGSSDYALGQVWITEESKRRFAAFDVQDGEAGEPSHFWGQIDEFERDGDSRRIQYARLDTWNDCKAFAEDHGVTMRGSAYFDATGKRAREIYGKCEEWGSYAMISTDRTEFEHYKENPLGKSKPQIKFWLPYSEHTREDAYAGKGVERIKRWSNMPAGFCWSYRWSKPVIGGYILALKNNQSRYYGIPRDILPAYTDQLNSYMLIPDVTKKTGVTTMILRQMKKHDHSFSTSSLCLLGAIIAGYFPLAETQLITQAA